jgi:hypothetical protein
MHSSSTAVRRVNLPGSVGEQEALSTLSAAALTTAGRGGRRNQHGLCFTLNNSLFTAERLFTTPTVQGTRVFKPFG